MAWTVTVLLLVIVIAFFILLPPGKGELPQFTDENGQVMENSIAEKTKLNIDGQDVELMILGEDVNKPVLMVCGGGPGIPQYLLEDLYPSVLPEKFVVCYFDYVGCGASYTKLDPETITLDTLTAETLAVTEYLKQRFSQEKIYIMGHSFGTYIALNMVKEHPEHYSAYLAVAQVVNQRESEFMAYDYMKQAYAELGDTGMVKKLEKYRIRESEEDFNAYKHAGLRDKAMHKLGVGTARDMRSVVTGLVLPSLRCKAYTMGQRINIWKGKIQSNHFKVSCHDFNALEDVPKVDIPIYFFGGEYDYTCCITLQKQYYEAVEAPKKAFYSYPEAGHSPVYEDRERTAQILDEILKNDAK